MTHYEKRTTEKVLKFALSDCSNVHSPNAQTNVDLIALNQIAMLNFETNFTSDSKYTYQLHTVSAQS